MFKPDRVAQDDVNVQSAGLRCNIGIMGDRSRTLFRRFGVSEFTVKIAHTGLDSAELFV